MTISVSAELFYNSRSWMFMFMKLDVAHTRFSEIQRLVSVKLLLSEMGAACFTLKAMLD